MKESFEKSIRYHERVYRSIVSSDPDNPFLYPELSAYPTLYVQQMKKLFGILNSLILNEMKLSFFLK